MTELPVLLPALPEIFLAGATLGILLLCVFLEGEKAGRVAHVLALAALAVTVALLLLNGGGRRLALNGLFIADGFALYVKVLVLAAAIMVLVAGQAYVREKMSAFEYPVLICFAVLGMMMMVSANGLMSLYLGLELQSLSLYVAAAFRRDSGRATEAGLKYFVLGAVSSGLLLYGCSLIYGFTGTLDFDGLAYLLDGAAPASAGVVTGLMFLLAGLAFKVSAVPFHMWTPDVYEGAPTPVTAFFAAAPKIAALALLIRVLAGPFQGMLEDWRQVIILLSVLSMLLGAFAAIVQTDLKRLLAYSSIGHAGYALIGLAAGTAESVQAMLIYLAVYLFMTVGVFACILALRVNDRTIRAIPELAGLKSEKPLLALVLMVLMFSMAGIPPMAGFIGKFVIFKAAVDSGLTLLAVTGALASVVSAFYYLRIIKIMYFDAPSITVVRIPGVWHAAVIALAGVFSASFLIYVPLVSLPAAQASRALFGN